MLLSCRKVPLRWGLSLETTEWYDSPRCGEGELYDPYCAEEIVYWLVMSDWGSTAWHSMCSDGQSSCSGYQGRPMRDWSDCVWYPGVVAFLGAQAQHIFREANTVADKIASIQHLLPLPTLVFHPDLSALVRKDALGRRLSIPRPLPKLSPHKKILKNENFVW